MDKGGAEVREVVEVGGTGYGKDDDSVVDEEVVIEEGNLGGSGVGVRLHKAIDSEINASMDVAWERWQWS